VAYLRGGRRGRVAPGGTSEGGNTWKWGRKNACKIGKNENLKVNDKEILESMTKQKKFWRLKKFF